MALKTTVFDPKVYLRDPSTHLPFLREAFESDDEPHIAGAVMLIAELRGLEALAARAGAVRDQAFREIGWDGQSPREPRILDFDRLKSLVEELGYRLAPQLPQAQVQEAA